MKEFYIYIGVIIGWSLFLTWLGIPEDKIFRSLMSFFFVFGLKQLIDIKNNTN